MSGSVFADTLLTKACALSQIVSSNPNRGFTLNQGSEGRLYTFLIRYDKAIGKESRVLSLRLFGPLEDVRVWAALRWVASAMISVSRDWPGVLWEGWPECAENHVERAYFTTPDKVMLVLARPCSPEV